MYDWDTESGPERDLKKSGEAGFLHSHAWIDPPNRVFTLLCDLIGL